jgi:DNA replication protein DnaC
MDTGLENLHSTLRSLAAAVKERCGRIPDTEKLRLREGQRQLEEAEKEAGQREFYRSRGIPPRYYGVSWDNWEAKTPEQRKAAATVRECAWKQNLFLCGPAGTGKTRLAMCLAREGAAYRRLPDIFREVRADLNSEQRIIDFYGSRKLLVIDEVGRQKFSPFENNLFFEIIDLRWNNILPTTLITNMREQEFADEYGTAVLDRLRPLTVRFAWESRRN